MKRIICTIALSFFAVGIVPLAQALAQTDVVVPAELVESAGRSNEGTALGHFSNTVQAVYSESILNAAGIKVGDQITGLAFRVDRGLSSPIWSVADYQIRLATSNNPAGMLSDNFSVNRGDDYTVVRSGALSYDGSEYDVASLGFVDPPNDFGPTIAFNLSSFTYQGGDLLLEYTHSPVGDNAVGTSADSEIVTGELQTQFGVGFDASVRGFIGGEDRAPVVRFTVVSDPILLGDVNLSGGVDFLDISPFIAVLSSGVFQAEADIDGNGVVDFRDISPFITILSNPQGNRTLKSEGLYRSHFVSFVDNSPALRGIGSDLDVRIFFRNR